MNSKLRSQTIHIVCSMLGDMENLNSKIFWLGREALFCLFLGTAFPVNQAIMQNSLLMVARCKLTLLQRRHPCK